MGCSAHRCYDWVTGNERQWRSHNASAVNRCGTLGYHNAPAFGPGRQDFKNTITNTQMVLSSMLLHPYTALLQKPPVLKTPLFAPFFFIKRTFYQDRLGTNIWLLVSLVVLCSEERASEHSISGGLAIGVPVYRTVRILGFPPLCGFCSGFCFCSILLLPLSQRERRAHSRWHLRSPCPSFAFSALCHHPPDRGGQ